MNALLNPAAAPVTMTSRGVSCQIAPDIAAMSREDMAIILHGMACKAQLIEWQWVSRNSYSSLGDVEKSECPSIARIYAALADYERLAFCEDALAGMQQRKDSAPSGGHVYVIEFDDGHIKIGHSSTPDQRIKGLIAGNQARALQSWISPRSSISSSMECIAHRHFAADRAGGEFFRTSYQTAVNWIAGEWAKHQLHAEVA